MLHTMSAALRGRRSVASGALRALALIAVVWAAEARGEVSITVRLGEKVAEAPVSGRLIVLLIGPGAKLDAGQNPIDGPFWDDPQPLFGMDVSGLKPGGAVMLDTSATCFPMRPEQLGPGTYRAAARLVANRQTSNWRDDAGNYYSDPITFTVTGTAGGVAEMVLTHRTEEHAPKAIAGMEFFEVRSALLSDFHKRDVILRAGVVYPTGFDAAKGAGGARYAAIYEVPGFGGRHFSAVDEARGRAEGRGKAAAERALNAGTFKIVLDPESPNGHTLFADSANNGPWGRALTEELVPALEAKFPLIREPSARLLRGHSSGGWSTLWLALNYPGVFGATWSSAPDPIDFRAFQLFDIYDGASAFDLSAGVPAVASADVEWARAHGLASFRTGKMPVMSVRQEVGGENVCGPMNTSGQQWASWQAVWGPRDGHGHPAALFDPVTGVIDRAVAEKYRAYDIGLLLRTNPEKFGPLFRSNVRLVVGGLDSFYLNEAVALVKADLEKVPVGGGSKPVGYIRIVPGLDHGSVFGSKEIRGFPAEMVEHLKACGHLAK